MGSSLLLLIVSRRGLRRGSGSASQGHFDEQCLVHRVPAGEVNVEGLADGLLGAQCSLLPVLSWDDPQRDVGRIEAPPQGVCVLLQDHVAHVVDQLVLQHGDQRRRRPGALDPDLATDHAGLDVGIVVGDVIGALLAQRRRELVRRQQRPDQRRLLLGEEALLPCWAERLVIMAVVVVAAG